MKLLIIEDVPEIIRDLREAIEEKFPDARCKDCENFDLAERQITEFEPDAIILDLLAPGNPAERPAPGLDISCFVWDYRFCPIVVYSAEPERHENASGNHPFVRKIKKGSGSLDKVVEALCGFKPYIDAFNETEECIRTAFSRAMRDVAQQVFKTVADDETRQIETIRRAGRRRLAAMMDEPSSDDPLAPWEIYLCPPMSKSLLLGDILRLSGGDETDPNSFSVVLTPSCDLESGENRKPKVDDVLVAQCRSTSHGLKRTNLSSKKKNSENIRKQLLTPGHLNGIVPFPAYHGEIPTMVADLRQLRLISFGNIRREECGEEYEYVRVASIDSPFRELIAWAHMQTAARPGLPDRDFDGWCEEILVDAEKKEPAKGE